MMASDVQQKIAEALDAGHPMSAIAEHLASHENPDYQAYGKSWLESANALPTRKSDFQEEKKNLVGSITPMLDLANQNPNATLGLLGGAAATYAGYKVKNALEDRRIRRETHESEMEKNKAYVRQVELQAKNVAGTPELTTKEIAQSVKQAEGVTPQAKPNPLNAYAEQKYKVPLATLEQVSGGTLKSIADVDVVGGAFTKGGNISVNQTGAFTPKTDYTKTAVVPKEFAPPLSQFDTSKLGEPFDVTRLGESRDPLANRGFQYPVVPTAEPIPVEPTEKPKSKVKKPISPEDSGLTKQELGMKKHLLHLYGAEDYPTSAEKAYAKVKDILGYTPAYEPGKGGSLNPEEKGKVLAYRKENIEGPKVNLTKPMKDILKKGGEAAAVLVSTIEFANAKTREEKANAGIDLLSAVLPPGADILEAGAPTVNQQTIANAYKLGSPYAQTEQAKLARLRERAGAGRGIAPPSAYMR
jgi:hypothetical protein